MKAQIVYDKPCRIRFRCGSDAFTKELERSIHKLVMSNPWAVACEAHYENGGILIRYKEGHRAEAVELVRKLRGSDLAPVSDNQYDTEEIDRTFKSDLAKLVMQRYIRKAILPAPIGAALIVYSGLKYIAKGVSALFDGKLTVEVLDGASISACLIQKNYNTAGTVMFLLSVSGLLEDYTRARTRAALTDSLAIKADQVWLAGKDADTLIPMSQLQVDDCIRVRTGSVIPVDGQITEGEAYINEASMTGEPLAVMKSAGASVFAGTVVEEGSVVIKVRKLSSDTKISKIIELIDNSENLKAGVQSRAETLADSIVPFSFLGFGLTLLLTGNITKAVSLLMVDYSCAIKLSMPISVISAIKEAADMNITVKGGKYLEEFANADTVVFDKTGTLTNAEPVLETVIPFGGYTEDEALKIAACLEEHFPHSMANAVVRAAQQRGLTHEEMHSQVQYLVAHGIASTVKGEKVIIGSYHFVFEDEQSTVPAGEQAKFDALPPEYSHLYLAVDNVLEAVLCIEDPVREEAKQIIRELKREGFTKIVMMTGDSERTAAAIAKQIGVDEYHAEVLPEDKANFVQQEKEAGRRVVMVGDGINDSPALSAADVGIAISDGSELAREIADITVGADSLQELVYLRRLSKEMMRRIHVNYRAILGINGSLIAAGVTGLIQPTTSALLHNTTTLALSLRSMSWKVPGEAGQE